MKKLSLYLLAFIIEMGSLSQSYGACLFKREPKPEYQFIADARSMKSRLSSLRVLRDCVNDFPPAAPDILHEPTRMAWVKEVLRSFLKNTETDPIFLDQTEHKTIALPTLGTAVYWLHSRYKLGETVYKSFYIQALVPVGVFCGEGTPPLLLRRYASKYVLMCGIGNLLDMLTLPLTAETNLEEAIKAKLGGSFLEEYLARKFHQDVQELHPNMFHFGGSFFENALPVIERAKQWTVEENRVLYQDATIAHFVLDTPVHMWRLIDRFTNPRPGAVRDMPLAASSHRRWGDSERVARMREREDGIKSLWGSPLPDVKIASKASGPKVDDDDTPPASPKSGQAGRAPSPKKASPATKKPGSPTGRRRSAYGPARPPSGKAAVRLQLLEDEDDDL